MKGVILLSGDDFENQCLTHTGPRNRGKAVGQRKKERQHTVNCATGLTDSTE